MEFIDTHAHLYAEEFNEDRSEVLEKAIGEGVSKIVLPAIDSKSHNAMIEMAEANPELAIPLMGLHPTSVNSDYKKELALVEKFISQKRSLFYGIGEIGIDLYWDKTFYKEQVDAFTTQVNWAKELKWPIVIHVRDSFEEVYKVLKPLATDGLTGIFHCFGDNLEQARKATDMGFLLGIGGVVTFKNTNLREVLQQVELNHIVLETDSPYLAPVPFRGKRNESSYISLIAEKLAEVYGCSIEEIAKITTQNASRVFAL
ncbi:MAG: TatD family hydrolase [Salinivirgaceae bacterium]|jgi:TatD DNase family protein|nr:TatD family hydrolase [Salinivirgaceae bacterium]